MFDFLLDADIYLKTFWYTAITVSLIFIVQAVLTLTGLGHADADTDVSGDFGHIDSPMELFTLRNMINFLLGFSWGGISFYHTIESKFVLVLASLAVGVIFVALFFYIIQQFKKLEENNTFDHQSVVGSEADVYLRLPAEGQGSGKIHVTFNGSLHEIDAVSSAEEIMTGEKVLILESLSDQKVLVKKL